WADRAAPPRSARAPILRGGSGPFAVRSRRPVRPAARPAPAVWAVPAVRPGPAVRSVPAARPAPAAGSSQRLRTVAAPRQRSAREGARAETRGGSPQTCQNGADRTVRSAVLRYEEVTRGFTPTALAAHRTPGESTRSAPGPSGPRA